MSSLFFNTLNYSLANEDTTLEMNVLPEGSHHVVSVAGSGARVLPLFAKQPQKLMCVDLTTEQLLLTELRIEAARLLSRDEYLQFWGYPPQKASSDFRSRVFSELNVSIECRNFFRPALLNGSWDDILYSGRWERTFSKIAKMCRAFLGSHADQIFAARDLSEHKKYMDREFPWWRWNILVFVIGNSSFFNTLLYRGHFPKKNTPGTHWDFYKGAYERIFSMTPARENYFLQMTILGMLQYSEGNPVECQPGIYEKIQTGIRRAKIRYQRASVVDFIGSQSDDSVDFVSLSDTPSYYDEKISAQFLQLMSPGLNRESLVVARYYLRVLDAIETRGFRSVTEDYRSLIATEKTQMYTFDIFKKS